MKKLYEACAMFKDGSTDEITRVSVIYSENLQTASKACDDYANVTKGIICTWVKTNTSSRAYHKKSYTRVDWV